MKDCILTCSAKVEGALSGRCTACWALGTERVSPRLRQAQRTVEAAPEEGKHFK